MFNIGIDVQIQAQIQTKDNGWEGSRQVPTFVLPTHALGMRGWDDCGARALDIMFPAGVPAEVCGVVVTLMMMDDEAEVATCTYVRRFGAHNLTQV